ncbi:zinc-finger homeodomain protein 11-like [Rutidosis leptorrhynchoides]|uniref:zinc-finger homeodomain protein 11-like n=1 Tax=Rutidosis leptorrhynchoides TaxID=125765 RepID=UPI003A9A5388
MRDEVELPTIVQSSRRETLLTPHLGLIDNRTFNRCHTSPITFPYRKCNRNHSLNTNHHVVDGCGEFMPSYVLHPSDPNYLNCAACGCHRSFHIEPNLPPAPRVNEYRWSPTPDFQHPQTSNTPRSPLSPQPISSSYVTALHHMTAAFNPGFPPHPTNQERTKRFRSKFTDDQKAKMKDFAERIGWNMKKESEGNVLTFCKSIGVSKRVFNVWMHNNRTKNVK